MLELRKMKKFCLIFAGFLILGQAAAEQEKLVCPRLDEIRTAIQEAKICDENQFLELSAKKIFSKELDYFDQEVVNKIMLDNVSNPNWLAQKGVSELRIHRLCLETACSEMLNKCDTNKNFKEDNEQNNWCQGTVDNIFDIEKLKIKTAVLENQRRKTRSAFREKFRAIEVRSSQYFIPNLISFVKEFKRFTDKVTAFVLKPLQ